MTRVVFDRGQIQRLLEEVDGPVGKFLVRTVLRVEGAAKRRAPVDTGRLRASITHEVERDRTGLVARAGSNVEYAPYVELGTSRMAPRAFLRGALEAIVGRGGRS